MSDIPWSIILDFERLIDLRSLNIIGTQNEQSYDDLANIACLICNTPTALVSLVDEDRQWFKAHVGIGIQQTPIDQSVCVHALDKTEVLIINDLLEDIRTKDNTLVTGDTSLRFYAGVPLRLEANFGVGTLCVLDTKPHPQGLAPVQIKALEALGRQATILLQIRRFIALQNDDSKENRKVEEPLDAISDALISAYKINESLDDPILEKLIAASLKRVAQYVSENEDLDNSSIH